MISAPPLVTEVVLAEPLPETTTLPPNDIVFVCAWPPDATTIDPPLETVFEFPAPPESTSSMLPLVIVSPELVTPDVTLVVVVKTAGSSGDSRGRFSFLFAQRITSRCSARSRRTSDRRRQARPFGATAHTPRSPTAGTRWRFVPPRI
jgi:hypothetical protein